MSDSFSSHNTSLNSPARSAFAITPSDSIDLPETTRAIYTGVGGTMVCILAGDTTAVTFDSLPAGVVIPLRIRRILSTGTTSSMQLIGLL